MVIVLISSNGYGQGKSTFAQYLKDKLIRNGYYTIRLAFAGRLKEVAKFMGWDGKKDSRGRKLLQKLGTEVGREYDPEMWAKWVDIEIYKESNLGIPPTIVVIDDWRFKNEFDYFKKRGYNVITVRIDGVEDRRDSHISEHDLDNFDKYDVRFTNNFVSPVDDFTMPSERVLALVEKYVPAFR